jgi:cyanophycin synthetase
VNAGPGIRMHHFPSQGKSRDAAGAIIDMLFPNGSTGRIPIISVTGTNGKTTVTKLLAHILSQSGKCVAATTTGGIYINGEAVARGDTTGPISAAAVLADPAVEIAVLETARGGLVKSGLGYDWSDVGVITNVQPDHIGQDGIEDLSDILRIKSLIAERVREGGTIVLNADDPSLVGLSESRELGRLPRVIAMFSVEDDSAPLRRHLRRGGKAYFVENGWILEAMGSSRHRLIRVADIPITFFATAAFQISNCLAAAAAARAAGASLDKIREGLVTFRPDLHNQGRSNFYRVGQGYLMIDYGHNPEAIRSIAQMTSHWRRQRVTGVIGLPGDRADELIKESARAAALGFDQILIREDRDHRGRAPGEVAGLILEEIKTIAPRMPCSVELDPISALAQSLDQILPGEIIVYFYEELEPVIQFLKSRNAEVLQDLTELSLIRPSEELLGVG